MATANLKKSEDYNIPQIIQILQHKITQIFTKTNTTEASLKNLKSENMEAVVLEAKNIILFSQVLRAKLVLREYFGSKISYLDAHFGTLTQRSVHPKAPVLLTKDSRNCSHGLPVCYCAVKGYTLIFTSFWDQTSSLKT